MRFLPVILTVALIGCKEVGSQALSGGSPIQAVPARALSISSPVIEYYKGQNSAFTITGSTSHFPFSNTTDLELSHSGLALNQIQIFLESDNPDLIAGVSPLARIDAEVDVEFSFNNPSALDSQNYESNLLNCVINAFSSVTAAVAGMTAEQYCASYPVSLNLVAKAGQSGSAHLKLIARATGVPDAVFEFDVVVEPNTP